MMVGFGSQVERCILRLDVVMVTWYYHSQYLQYPNMSLTSHQSSSSSSTTATLSLMCFHNFPSFTRSNRASEPWSNALSKKNAPTRMVRANVDVLLKRFW